MGRTFQIALPSGGTLFGVNFFMVLCIVYFAFSFSSFIANVLWNDSNDSFVEVIPPLPKASPLGQAPLHLSQNLLIHYRVSQPVAGLLP